MRDEPDASETGMGQQPPAEPATQPTESPTQQIRAALVAAICDGQHEPFTDEAIASQREGVTRLRQLVHVYMTHLRSRGMPPERAVGFMKALIRDTEIPCRRPLLALESQVMHWCIDAYYGADDADASRPRA
jgi:hypothetical protein